MELTKNSFHEHFKKNGLKLEKLYYIKSSDREIYLESVGSVASAWGSIKWAQRFTEESAIAICEAAAEKGIQAHLVEV